MAPAAAPKAQGKETTAESESRPQDVGSAATEHHKALMKEVEQRAAKVSEPPAPEPKARPKSAAKKLDATESMAPAPKDDAEGDVTMAMEEESDEKDETESVVTVASSSEQAVARLKNAVSMLGNSRKSKVFLGTALASLAPDLWEAAITRDMLDGEEINGVLANLSGPRAQAAKAAVATAAVEKTPSFVVKNADPAGDDNKLTDGSEGRALHLVVKKSQIELQEEAKSGPWSGKDAYQYRAVEEFLEKVAQSCPYTDDGWKHRGSVPDVIPKGPWSEAYQDHSGELLRGNPLHDLAIADAESLSRIGGSVKEADRTVQDMSRWLVAIPRHAAPSEELFTMYGQDRHRWAKVKQQHGRKPVNITRDAGGWARLDILFDAAKEEAPPWYKALKKGGHREEWPKYMAKATCDGAKGTNVRIELAALVPKDEVSDFHPNRVDGVRTARDGQGHPGQFR